MLFTLGNVVNHEEASATHCLPVIGGYLEANTPLGNREYFLSLSDSVFKDLAIKEKGQNEKLSSCLKLASWRYES